MIKIDKENFKIETDCKTVGEFMTEAAALFANCVVIVDGCRYEFFDSPKIRVTDDTPLGSVAVERADSLLSGVTVLRVTTAPKPKTVKRSGWVNVFKYSDTDPFPAGVIYPDKKSCESDEAFLSCKDIFVAVAKIEWEEVVK